MGLNRKREDGDAQRGPDGGEQVMFAAEIPKSLDGAVNRRREHDQRPHPRHPKSARTKSAQRSPIMILGALVLPPTSRGMIEASAM